MTFTTPVVLGVVGGCVGGYLAYKEQTPSAMSELTSVTWRVPITPNYHLK
jgi:hypothetical protein